MLASVLQNVVQELSDALTAHAEHLTRVVEIAVFTVSTQASTSSRALSAVRSMSSVVALLYLRTMNQFRSAGAHERNDGTVAFPPRRIRCST